MLTLCAFVSVQIGAIARFAGTGAAWISAGGSALSRESVGVASQATSPAHGVRRLIDAEDIPEVRSLKLSDSECKRTALNSPSRVMDHILTSLRTTATNAENTWHVRVAVARFLQIWLPRHSLALNADQLVFVETLLIDVLLIDVQPEVREAASQAFQSFVSSSFPLRLPSRSDLESRSNEDSGDGEGSVLFSPVLQPHPHIVRLISKLEAMVESTNRKPGKPVASKTIDAATLAKRHGALLALTGCVLTHPYDVPAHLPALLSFLSKYVEDRAQSVSSTLRKFFLSFTSSHKDEWATFARQFTQTQLEELQSMQLAPSYFA